MSSGLSDLHRHLDGAARQATLEELAGQARRRTPQPLRAQTVIPYPDLLEKLGPVLALLQHPDAVRRVADEACQDAAAEGVTTLELRLAPQLHQGGTPEQVVDAALAGIAGRAGLVLSGVQGEPPDVLEHLVEIAAARPGVVGIDLAGIPRAESYWILESYGPPLRRAATLGLGRTVHAGEVGPAEDVLIAIEALGAQRIGGGLTLLEDPHATEQVRRRGVVLEVCLSASLAGGLCPAEDHPLPMLLRAGLRVTLGTDWPWLVRTSARDELRRARRLRGIGPREESRLTAEGHAAAFPRRASPTSSGGVEPAPAGSPAPAPP